MTIRVGAYARCSTDTQKTDTQVYRLREYAKLRGMEIVDTFVDHGVSGRKAQRPALNAMMEAARRREIDAVMVIRLDRLARSVAHLVSIAAELEALNVAMVVVEQALDTTTPSGRLLFHVLASIAAFETDLLRERTAAGIAHARRKGVRFGRPERCDKGLKDRIRRLRSSGATIQRISELTGVSVGTTHRVVQAS